MLIRPLLVQTDIILKFISQVLGLSTHLFRSFRILLHLCIGPQMARLIFNFRLEVGCFKNIFNFLTSVLISFGLRLGNGGQEIPSPCLFLPTYLSHIVFFIEEF